MRTKTHTKKKPKTRILILLFILMSAGVFRIWGIGFGLPNTECRPDESPLVFRSLRMGLGDLNPHCFNYPTLHLYMCFSSYVLYYFLGRTAGHFENPFDLGVQFFLDPSVFFLISRLLSALAGILTVWILYKISRRAFNEKTALLAALFLAVTPLHVRDSHFGVTDVLMGLFVMVSVYFALKFLQEGRMLFGLMSAAAAGLAASTKYNGIIVLAAVFSAQLILLHREKRLFSLHAAGKILALAALAGLAFILTSPFVILDAEEFVTDFLFEMNHMQGGHAGINLGRGWLYHLRFSLFYGMGWGLFLISFYGFYVMVSRNKKVGIVLLSFPLAYYLLIGGSLTVFTRYVIPLLPFFAMAAAAGVADLSKRISLRVRNVRPFGAAAVMSVLLLVPSLWNIYQSNRLLSGRDSRLLAADWIEKNIPGGSSVYQNTSLWGKIGLAASQAPPDVVFSTKYKHEWKRLTEMQREYRRRHNIPVYDLWYFREGKFYQYGSVREGLPDVIVVEKSALAFYSPVLPQKISDMIKDHYELSHTVPAAVPLDPRNKYDQQDAFYLPLAGFHHISRPGPNLYIYQLRRTRAYKANLPER